ncbi:MAG: hypothetical protein Q9160_006861 [Pyrenula sp. 1 TL-2023]
MHDSHIRRRTKQQSQFNQTDFQPPSSYWDNLSKIWLTKGALKELDRRNNILNEHSSLCQRERRPLIQDLAECDKDQRTVSEILRIYSADDVKGLKRFSRLGGIEPVNPLEHSRRLPTAHASTSKNKGAPNTVTDSTIKTKNTGPYSRNFEQVLIDYGVFLPFYEYTDGEEPAEPDNLDEIKQRLKQPRSSLSPPRFTDKDFKKFQKAVMNAKKPEQTTKSVVPIIEGDSQATNHVCGKINFGNLHGLTEGCTLTPGNPDLYDGANSGHLKRRVWNTLKNTIIPSTQDNLPIAPNFFLHVKARDGNEAVAIRQAVYDGALGERGQLNLRSYGQKEFNFDNNAHTITSTSLHSTLSMYTVYTARTKSLNSRQEYYTHLIGSWAINGGIQSFQNGAAAFRNLRDWAKEQRDEAIAFANGVLDQVEGEKNSGDSGNSGEEHTESDVASDSTLRAPSDDVDSSNGRIPSSAKRPSASSLDRPSKSAKRKK